MTNAHLDSAVLATLQDVMEGEYPALLDTFLTDSEERVRLLRQALHSDQSESLRRAAHSFKGSCSNMGATLLAELCQQPRSSDLLHRKDSKYPALAGLHQQHIYGGNARRVLALLRRRCAKPP